MQYTEKVTELYIHFKWMRSMVQELYRIKVASKKKRQW